MLLTTGEGVVIYPAVNVVIVDSIKCRALLDTAAGRLYASSALVKRLGEQPSRTELKRVDMMMTVLCSTSQKIEQYKVKMGSLDKGVLLSVPNPGYAEKINKYPHLEGAVMDDDDTKPYWEQVSRIKTNTKTIV